jgi:hypothetical protein
MVVRQQHDVDGRQLLERDPGRVDPLRSPKPRRSFGLRGR